MAKLEKVRAFEETTGGFSVWSRIDSYIAWRDTANKLDRTLDELRLINAQKIGMANICPVCNGMKETTDDSYGTMWCLCYLHDYMERLEQDWTSVGLPVPTFTENLDDLVEHDARVTRLKDAARAFVEYPSWNLTIWGSSGQGKTHALHWIVSQLKGMAFYLSGDGFEQKIHAAMDKRIINEFMAVVQKVPILILDDYGIEHGASFVQGKMRAIINDRYEKRNELRLIVATNLDINTMYDKDMRSASRLNDKGFAHVLSLGDYREKKQDGTRGLQDWRMLSEQARDKKKEES